MTPSPPEAPQEHPKFVCQREGHVPAVSFKFKEGTVKVESYGTTCLRCGEWATFPAGELD